MSVTTKGSSTADCSLNDARTCLHFFTNQRHCSLQLNSTHWPGLEALVVVLPLLELLLLGMSSGAGDV